MMSSSPQTTTRTTGAHAHRAHREARDRGAARNLAQRPPARYEPYLDGLFTYCLSVLCDHDTATAALGDALALAERRGQRVPESAADRRAWLYALARWSCLRKLAEAKQKRQATHAAGRSGAHSQPSTPPLSEQVLEDRRRQLALLAWPEAAGTTPEQREALELAVRHHLAAHEVAAVLGMDPTAARELLASAACEVERTRAALAVVETGTCPSVARLTGDNQLVLSTALRRELVRHVDDCPRCRRTAESAVPGRWPGATVTPAELPVLEAPRAALHVAMAHVPRARGTAPRFDRRGFPMDPKDRAARRDRLRARAVTTTVIATVVAAPVLALWAAYRGTPTGESAEGRSASASEARDPDALYGEATGGYESAGNTGTHPGGGFGKGAKPDVSVEVISVTGAGKKGAGHLEVTAINRGDTTLITLAATSDAPVRWSASTGASWLYLSRSSGTLAPGESLTIKVYVDPLREPSGYWSAQVAVSPAGAVVRIEGYGTAPSPSAPGPGGPDPTPTSPTPSDPPPTSPDPTPTDPEPTPTDPAPTDPTPSDPPPSSSDPDPPPSGPADPGGSTPPPSDSGDPSPSTS
ncbi:sigma-70 family RNA polymerase sigma factor [Streptomyces cupreus]|uniref:Sigma-70 family RNA polymerase sigma factor n=1 Tax=Streptomyces cupreus TaxID=2759956 RepID=A0A7X1J498_9ACTN|nr:sigma-70 family RNA polymerase sigma factor [Streptomyces cupreus]MBC2903900.1 sigma-70 family RNA polymerase sigma factor [Streptomyces cupreus]